LLTRSTRCAGLRLVFSLQIALDTPHVGHGGGSDYHTGYPEQSSHRQLGGREGVFDTSHGSFDSRTQVTGFSLAFLAAPSSLGSVCFGLGEAQVEARIAFAGPGWALVFFEEGASLANGGVDVGNKAFLLTGGMGRYTLPMWTSDLQGLAVLVVQLDLEIRQV